MGNRKIPVAIDKFKEEPAAADGEAGDANECADDTNGVPEEEKKATADDNDGEEAKVEEKEDEEDDLTPVEWDLRIIEAFHRTIYESVLDEDLPMEPSDF